jgi:hypothetical protein
MVMVYHFFFTYPMQCWHIISIFSFYSGRYNVSAFSEVWMKP